MLTQIFMYEGAQVRTVMIDGEPHCIAKDVCEILEINNSRDALSRLDDDEKGVATTDTLGGSQQMTTVNEAGLYNLIFTSRKPEAKAFKRWVTHEVLPSIRKTGSYESQPQLPQNYKEALLALVSQVEKTEMLEAENYQLALQSAEQKQKLIEQETPVAIYNLAIAAHNTMSMQEIAKSLGTGRTKLYNILREEKVVMKNSTMPYQRFLDDGYFKVTERPRASGDTIINDPATRVTAKGFEYIAKIIQRRASNS